MNTRRKTMKALLVGINEYPGCPLFGCVNDVNNFAQHLVDRYKFQMDSIRLLCDARATTMEILTRLSWLVDVKPGDQCLFYYSGHGAQVATRDKTHEIDGLDEVICPVDFDWTDGHLIRDKQFFQIFSRIPQGVKFNWVSDSCHSGDLTKDLLPQNPHVKIPKRMIPPADIAWRNRAAKSKGHAPRAIVGGKLDVGYISGCRSDQTSADTVMGGKPCGALSYFLLESLKALPPATTVVDLVKHINGDLAKNSYDQQPQAEGARVNMPFLG